MTLKNYNRIRIALTVLLAIVFSQAIVLDNFIIPLALMVVTALALMLMRRRVDGVIADERDYAIAGRAALLSIQIYGWVAAASMIVLYSLRDLNPSYEPVAMTLAFSTCALMLLYSLVFRYHGRFKFSNKKAIFIFFAVVLLLLAAIVSLRVFSGEDDWICVNGAWQQHGRPSFPAPAVECR